MLYLMFFPKTFELYYAIFFEYKNYKESPNILMYSNKTVILIMTIKISLNS